METGAERPHNLAIGTCLSSDNKDPHLGCNLGIDVAG